MKTETAVKPSHTPTRVTEKVESKNQNPYSLSDALTWIAVASNEIDTNAPGDFAYTKVYRDSPLAGALSFVAEEKDNIVRAVNAHEELVHCLKDALATLQGIGRGSNEQRERYQRAIAKAEGR